MTSENILNSTQTKVKLQHKVMICVFLETWWAEIIFCKLFASSTDLAVNIFMVELLSFWIASQKKVCIYSKLVKLAM